MKKETLMLRVLNGLAKAAIDTPYLTIIYYGLEERRAM